MKRMDQIKRRIGILLAAAMLGLSSCGAPADRESVQTSPETREEVTSGEEILPSSREAADPAPADTEKTAMETSETSDQSEPMTPDPATQRTIYGDYAGPVYRIPMPWDNEYSVFLDRYGNQLTWPEVPSQVTDVLTGEVRYYCCMHLQEDGSAGYVLYDTEGNVVLEESPNWVNQCMGSLLVRTSVEYMSSQGEDLSDKCVLYDPASGEAVAKNVFYLKKMSEHSAIALDPDFHLVGILDENGTVLAGFPTEETYASPQPVGGYIKATLLKPGYSATVVLNDQCRCILHADGWDQEYRLFDCGKRGTYCGLQDWKEHTITTLYRTDPWEKLYLLDAMIIHMDGYRILGIGPRDDTEEGYDRYFLYDMEGTPLCGPYRGIQVLQTESDGTVSRYLAWDKDVLLLLDADGKVLKERSFQDLDSVYLVPETAYESGQATGISVSTWHMEPDADHGERYACALDLNLEDLFVSEYSHVEQVNDGLYWGRKRNPETENGAIELFAADGTVVLSGISSIGTAGPDGIPVMIGERAGLVDESGNWIGWCKWENTP